MIYMALEINLHINMLEDLPMYEKKKTQYFENIETHWRSCLFCNNTRVTNDKLTNLSFIFFQE